MISFPRIWVMSIAAMALMLGLGAAPAAAQTGGSDPELTVSDMLAAALLGDEAAHDALKAMFTRTAGRGPEEIADLAVDLIGALEGDPIEVADAADLIVELATESLNAVPVVRVSVDDEFELPEGAIGWDFGPPDSPVFEGFERVTPRDIEVGADDGILGVRRPGGLGLLSDGIRNVKKFRVDVPDGVYRLIVMTDDLGDRNRLKNPLGKFVIINGIRRILSATTPERWLDRGGLRGIRSRLDGGEGEGFLDTAGAYVIIVRVTNGVLEIEFVPEEAGDIFITALILEPADELPEEPEIELALIKIQEAQAVVFSQIETAVGDPRDVSPS